jgi:hypothetical protein
MGISALGTVDLVVSQGSDVIFEFTYLTGEPPEPVDLTACTARAQMRTTVGGAVWGTWNSASGITLDAVGNITLTVTHAETEAVEWNDYNKGVWDLEIIDSLGNITRLLEGKVRVSHDVTRTP